MAGRNSGPEPIKTILVIIVGLLVVYILTKWQWAINLSAIIGILGLSSNYIAKKITYVWVKLSWILSFIVPNILLTLIYFLFLVPLAYLSKIFGAPDQLTLKNPEHTLYKKTKRDFSKNSFEKMW